MADGSVCAGEMPRSDYIPLKDVERCKGHGVHEHHGGDAKQDAFYLCDWKYPTIERQSSGKDELYQRAPKPRLVGGSQACDVHGQFCHAGGQVEENLEEIECVEEASGGIHGT